MVNLHIDLVPVPKCQISLLSHPSTLDLHEQIFHTHSHTCTYGDLSPKADIPTLPLTPRSASPTPLCHVFDHGSQWRVWRVLTAPLPSCCQALCHYNLLAQPSAAATLALSTTSGNTDASCVYVCSCTYLGLRANAYVLTHLQTCLHPSSYLCVHLWHCLLFYLKIHCHVLMVNLPSPSAGDKGWLLA